MDNLEQQFEQHIAEALADETQPAAGTTPARVLMVSDDASLRAAAETLLRQAGHRVSAIDDLARAKAAALRQRFDVVILGPMPQAQQSLDSLRALRKAAPSSKAIVLTERLTSTEAVQALRCGAADLVSLPLEPREFLARVESAVAQSQGERQREQRLSRLKRICRELNLARHEISKQVDSLCEDLSNVYQDMAAQMGDVALAAEFRTLLRQELDVEDLLRTTLEYMLTKTGPTNAAVFLPDGTSPGLDGEKKHVSYGLGAYVNCNCPRETISATLDHLGSAICPQMADEHDIVMFDDAAEFSEWIGADAECLADSQVIAFSCHHNNECLAVLVLFRSRETPFGDKVAGILDTMRGIIAEQLHKVVKVHHRASNEWPKEADDTDADYGIGDDYGFGLAA